MTAGTWIRLNPPNTSRHRVITHARQRMASQQSPASQQSSDNRSMPLDRFHRVLGAGRNEAAGIRQRRRYPSLVGGQHPLQTPLHSSCAFGSRARCIASLRPRSTSASNSSNGNRKTDFRGLNTTSTGPLSEGHAKRTASRILRLIRFRSTEPPNTFPTVKPTLSEQHSPAASVLRRRKNTVMFPVNCRRPC